MAVPETSCKGIGSHRRRKRFTYAVCRNAVRGLLAEKQKTILRIQSMKYEQGSWKRIGGGEKIKTVLNGGRVRAGKRRGGRGPTNSAETATENLACRRTETKAYRAPEGLRPGKLPKEKKKKDVGYR